MTEPGLNGLLRLGGSLTGKDIEIGIKDRAADFDSNGFNTHGGFAVQFVQHRLLLAALQNTRPGVGIGSNKFGGIIYRVRTAVPLRRNLAHVRGNITLQLIIKWLVKCRDRRSRRCSGGG